MLKMVDGTGIIGVDMICPLGVSTPQPPNYDRVELEGAGILVLPNSLDAPLERLELGGKTEQVQTTGKNLANPSEFVIGTIAGDTGNIIGLKQYIATGYIPVIPGKRYSTSCGNKFFAHAIFAYDKEKTKINYPMNMSSEMPEGAAYIRLSYKKIDMTNVTESDMEELKKVCMVNEGSTVLPYEPYTGGKPSPSPEYPQEIKNVGKRNEETQKYEVDVKVTGKNLLNLQKEPDVKGLYQGWKVGNGDKGTLSIKDKGNNADISECYFGLNSDGTTSYSVTWLVDNGVIKRYHIESIEKMYACMYPPNETIIKKITERFEIQYEYGSMATEYQPYKEQNLTLTSDRPITKWDRLVEQGGQIGWLYGSVIATIDETADISLYAPNGFFIHVKNIDKKEKSGYCDKLYTKKMSNGEPFVLFGIANNNFLYTLNTQEFYGKTATEIKAKLKEYPLNIIGKSETTEFVPLPQSEQNAIRALKTYYPTTVITVDGGELDPDIKVTYRKEI